MLRADEIVLMDTVQYSRQSFQNRTRIRNPLGGQWLSIPLCGGQFGDSIADTAVDAESAWRRRHDKALRFNYSTSPFYQHFRPKLDTVFESDATLLGDVTCAAMCAAAALLGTGAPIARASELAGRPSTAKDVMSGYRGATCLLPASIPAIELPSEHRTACSFVEEAWRQNFDGFVSGTGSLDLLFNLGPNARAYLLANSRLDF